ncbi:FA81B protein, partial [Amia calva]|nr:FA81B protein [Amia calva]
MLEGRLSSQERTMATLLEQAFRIKDDIITKLRVNQDSSQNEAASRRLLENHILTITHIVQQLSKDIEVLEGQIIQRDGVSSGTSFAVQSLDHKNLAGIGDLRGRVARCDASIAKLSGDVSSTNREIQSLQKEITEVRGAVDLCLKDTKLKITQVMGKMEAALLEQNSSLKTTWGNQHREIELLDMKTSSTLNDLRDQLKQHRRWAEQQLLQSEHVQSQGAAQLHSLLQETEEKMGKKIEEDISFFTIRLQNVEEKQELEIKANRVKHAEDKLTSKIRRLEKTIWEELDSIKNEYRSGFQSLHDAIDSLRQINDTKSRLDKEKLQKDIKQIRRKIVELKDI